MALASRKLTGKVYLRSHTLSLSKWVGRVAGQRIKEGNFDLVFAPAESVSLAHLETDLPIIYLSDTTLALLSNYYPEFSNLRPRSLREANAIEQMAIHKARLLLFTSAWAARSAVRDYGADERRVHVVPLGANIDEWPSAEEALFHPASATCKLLFVGVEWERKGGEIAFETLSALDRMGFDAELTIVGCVPPKHVRHPKLRVIPFLNKNLPEEKQRLTNLFKEADFFLLPTRNECCAIAFCEANAFGLPVVSNDTGGVSEVIQSGENGYLLSPADRGDAYARVIADCFRNQARYQAMRCRSREIFEERLNWDAWGAAVRPLLESACASRAETVESRVAMAFQERLPHVNGTRRQVLEHEQPVTREVVDAARLHSEACPLCDSTQIAPFLTASDRFHMRREMYQLLRCSLCSAVWLDQPPRPDQMAIHYDHDYHEAITTAGEAYPETRWGRHREVIARYKQGGAILDIGCSSGAFLRAMKGESWKLHGIEMEASTAERARAATGAEVFVGDVDDAPFRPESFDVITAFDLLEHVYRPRQFLGNVMRWLKPGGIFFTMLPNIDSWESQLFGSYWYGLELPRHLFHFSPRSLRHLLTDLGFEELLVMTSTVSYAERSVGYLYVEALERAGFAPVAPSQAQVGSLPWRAVRKILRMGLVKPAGSLAGFAGAGANIEAVFRKPAVPENARQEDKDAGELVEMV